MNSFSLFASSFHYIKFKFWATLILGTKEQRETNTQIQKYTKYIRRRIFRHRLGQFCKAQNRGFSYLLIFLYQIVVRYMHLTYQSNLKYREHRYYFSFIYFRVTIISGDWMYMLFLYITFLLLKFSFNLFTSITLKICYWLKSSNVACELAVHIHIQKHTSKSACGRESTHFICFVICFRDTS